MYTNRYFMLKSETTENIVIAKINVTYLSLSSEVQLQQEHKTLVLARDQCPLLLEIPPEI